MALLLGILYTAVIYKCVKFLYQTKRARNGDRSVVANLAGMSALFMVLCAVQPVNDSTMWSTFAAFNSVIFYSIVVNLEERSTWKKQLPSSQKQQQGT